MVLVQRIWTEVINGEYITRRCRYGLEVIVTNYLKEKEGKLLTVKMIFQALNRRGFIVSSRQITLCLQKLGYKPALMWGNRNRRYTYSGSTGN